MPVCAWIGVKWLPGGHGTLLGKFTSKFGCDDAERSAIPENESSNLKNTQRQNFKYFQKI